jgi:glycosyltransferase involved in cell wall biosynthesis
MTLIKLFRITTVPVSLKTLLRGQHRFMASKGFEVVGVSSSGSELDDVARDEGIRTVALEITRTISPLKDLKALWQFYSLCKREKPTIVHSHTPKAGVVSMLGARMAGVPIRLHTVAGLPLMEASGLKRKMLDAVEKMTYACATKVYPNSQGLYDFILAHGYTTSQKLKVIGNGSSNGIDTAFFAPDQITEAQRIALKQSLGIQPDDFVFVFVGRIVGDKGINELITAFKRMNESADSQISEFTNKPVSRLLLVGPQEPELDPLQPETLEEIKNNPYIILVGFQPDVRPYFSVSNVLVFPSYREGFPNVVMQAGAMGLPAIVSDINGCNEIVIEGINGMIVQPKDPEILYSSMISMIDNTTYYQSLKVKTREMITKRYEQLVVWEALLAEYNRLLAEKKLK